MDLYKVIQELYGEKGKLERVIASLEELQRTAGAASELLPTLNRRGRKSMPADERAEVSERMKRYWAARRKLRQKQAPREG
ncbi:MAG: hypothetical protein ABSC23_00375 [Bryobacteraceae bacterium]|jgi:flagellar biosynthesis/type III secretory pathway chaperone